LSRLAGLQDSQDVRILLGIMRHLGSESDLIIDLTEVAMTSEAVEASSI